jgi:hypothetical protein
MLSSHESREKSSTPVFLKIRGSVISSEASVILVTPLVGQGVAAFAVACRRNSLIAAHSPFEYFVKSLAVAVAVRRPTACRPSIIPTQPLSIPYPEKLAWAADW